MERMRTSGNSKGMKIFELEEHYGYSREQGDDGNREEEEDDDDLVLELEQVLSPDGEESE